MLNLLNARYIVESLVVFILGFLAGLLGTWIDYRNEVIHGAQYSAHDYEWVTVLSSPGVILFSVVMDVDFRLTECWSLYRHQVAIINGIIFTVVFLIFAILRRLVNRTE